MDEPEVRDDSVSLEIDDCTFHFRGISCKSREFDAELEVIRPAPLDPLDAVMWNPNLEPFRFHISAHSLSNITNFRRAIDSYYGKDLPWDQLIIRACKQAEAIYRGASFIEWPEHSQGMQAVTHLVDGFIPEHQVSVLFGMGEAAKSLTAQSVLHMVSMGWPWTGRVTKQTNALWVDYENPKVDTFAFRRRRLTMGGVESYPGSIGWLNARGVPLTDQIDTIRREMDKIHATVLVVDSLALAAGGDAIEQRIANAFFNAVNKLQATVILIAHTNRAEDDRMPFGSVFWHNGIHGKSWYMKRAESEGDEITVGFYCRKVSDGRRPQDFAIRFAFEGEEGAITVEGADIKDVSRATGRLSIPQRIEDVLVDEGATSAKDLADQVGVGGDALRSILSRMRSKNQVVKLPDGRWGMAAK